MPQRQALPALNIEEIKTNLPRTSAVIMYHLANDQAGAWVISHEAVEWIFIKDRQALVEGILRYRTELLSTEPGSAQRLEEAARATYDLLLGPLSSMIEDKKELIIIPDGNTFLIPFEALVISQGGNAGKYLIEQQSVTYQMSLAGLLRNEEPAQPQEASRKSIMLVGNPTLPAQVSASHSEERAELAPLPGTEKEIERIRDIVGPVNVSVHTKDNATKERIQEELGQVTIAHFATHGVLNERYPWASYLAFAGQDGNLSLEEVSRNPIIADLVVLSACDTGRGRILAGEGVWGFQAQFLAAGAKSVVATLWKVEDESTAEFMGHFYREMGPQLAGYTDALRASKLKLIRSDKWNHPYYWAPFVLYGEAPMESCSVCTETIGVRP